MHIIVTTRLLCAVHIFDDVDMQNGAESRALPLGLPRAGFFAQLCGAMVCHDDDMGQLASMCLSFRGSRRLVGAGWPLSVRGSSAAVAVAVAVAVGRGGVRVGAAGAAP